MKARVAQGVDRKKLMLYLFVTLAAFTLVLIPAFVLPQYLEVISTINTTIILVIMVQFYIAIVFGLKKIREPPPLKEWPFVSIIIPAYNEESVLPRSIEANQSLDYPYDKLELIYVYEAKGTDRTEEILVDYASNDSRIKPLMRNAHNGGKAAATNYGIKHSRGDIIVCFDADHSLDASSLKRAVRRLMENPKVMCVKGRYRTINKDEGLLAKLSGIERDVSDRIIQYGHDVFGGFSCMGGNAFFKRKVFDELGYFDERTLTEDVDFSLKIHEAGYELRVDPSVFSWEESPASLTQWWHQRKRWSRGWIQSARKHIGVVMRCPRISLVKKIDTLYFLLLTILQPPMFLIYPSSILSLTMGLTISSVFPAWVINLLGILLTLSSVLAATMVWLKDYGDGERFRSDEVIMLPLVLFYMSLHVLVYWISFIEEFILRTRNEFVKTDRTGAVSTLMQLKSERVDPSV